MESESNPGDGRTPRAIRSNYAYSMSTSSYYLFDASFVKIKNINLSYSVPLNLIGRFSLSVWLSMLILQMFSLLPIIPDTIRNQVLQETVSPVSGLDYYSYPLARTYTFA